MTSRKDTHVVVRKAYGRIAKEAGTSCCANSCSCGSAKNQPVPEAELGLSCGNPVAFSRLRKGSVVLDLGSGGGKDVFAAAMKVGPAGRAIGVDMTAEMLRLARKNAAKFRKATGVENVEFRKGQIEKLPVDDASIDVVISNCVINLSPDKPRVFREIRRVLKPGGRMVVSDIVLDKPLPDSLKNDNDLYVACLAAAMMRADYLQAIRDAGFRYLRILADSSYSFTTSTGSRVRKGTAASITVVARKRMMR
ncbi:MAG TPA: arsenite methyltransferase [Planctomycetota bacterium]|nr:arsenite methyltransferase [Planctomycetota bacterium]